MTLDSIIGLHVQHLRKLAKRQQSECAVAMGVSQSTYSRLELGRQQWSMRQVVSIAAFLGTSPSKLMRRVEI